MKKGKITNKKNGLFSIFATLALALGVGLTLPPKATMETKAEGAEVALQTNFTGENSNGFNAGELTLETQVPEGTVTVSKAQAQIGSEGSNKFLVMGPTSSNRVAYVQFPFNPNNLSCLEVVYKAWPQEGAENKIKEQLDSATLAVEKLSGGIWHSIDQIDLKTEISGNQKTFAATLTGPGVYRVAYYISGNNAGEGNNNQAVIIDDLVFYKTGEASPSVVTELSVTPTTASLVTSAALVDSDYEVTITKDEGAGSSDDYGAQIGTGSGETFVGTNIIWGVTKPKVTDTTIQFKAYYPTTAGGSTYLSAEVAVTVAVGFGNLQYIEVTTMPTKTAFYVDESFTSAGLVVTAYDDSNPRLSKVVTSWYTNYAEGYTFTSGDQGPTLVYVVYAEGEITRQTDYVIMVEQRPNKYSKVTSISDLHEGAHYVISGEVSSQTYVMTTSGTNAFRNGQEATFEGGEIVERNNTQIIQLTPGFTSGTYGLRAVNGVSGFLAAGSSESDVLENVGSLNADSSWTITFGEEGISLVAAGSNTHNCLLFDGTAQGGPRFSAYAAGASNISLWVDEKTISNDPSVIITTQINEDYIYEEETRQFSAIAFNAGGASIVWSVPEDLHETATIDANTGLLTTYKSGHVEVIASVEGTDAQTSVYVYVQPSPYKQYRKVTSVDDLKLSANYLITGEVDDETYVMTTTENDGYRIGEVATFKNGKVLDNNNAQKIQLVPGNKNDTFGLSPYNREWGQFENHLAAASSSSDILEKVDQLSDDASWAITFSGETISLVSQGSSRCNTIMFDGEALEGARFSAFAGGKSSVSLWVDESSLPNNKMLTIRTRQSQIVVGENHQLNAFLTNLGSAAIVWSVDDEEVATIDSSTGLLTAVAPGSVSVEARVSVDGENYYAHEYINVHANNYNQAGSAEDPFTVRDALLKAQRAGRSETEHEYYVHGVISDVIELNVAKGYATFKIKDEGGYSELTAYQVKWGAEGSGFTSVTAANIAKDNEVTLVGKIVTYEYNSPRLVQNSKVLSVVAKDLAYEAANEFALWLLNDGRDKESCQDKFQIAQYKWLDLSAEAKVVFKTHADFTAARARLINWAIANGTTIEEMGNSGKDIRNNTINDNSIAITALIGVIGITTLVGYFLLKKRETSK